ncbi:PD40 domain-containing protein [Nocardia sp. XZ_19_385]|uniref:TolB family protein n=1 Tax=Nocardia sp. XZ_19_385 TaxID=2769488 RepID=UPI00188F36C6|nr:PD40 domain-containing protein [Nocardia sp. XZ_19_385]
MRQRRSRVLRAAAITLALAGLTAGCGSSGGPSPEPAKTAPRPAKIAFDDSKSIFVMNPDGTGVTRIAAGTDPNFAADGSKLVIGGGWISTMAPDGSGLRKLAEGGYEPVFSPDGTRIAFARGGAIFVMNTDGGELEQLGDLPAPTGPNQASSQSPAFAPDGSKIAFTRNGAIWTMASDGTGARPLLADHYNSNPVFSPDGATIVFASNRGGKNRSELYVMDTEGNDVRPLTDDWTVHPAFSPDGAQILYTRARSAPESGAELWVMNRDGSDPRMLSAPEQTAQHASWGAGSGS